MENIFSGSNNTGGYWLKFEDNDKIKNTKIPSCYYKIKLITTRENLEKDLSDECLIDRYDYGFEFSINECLENNMYQILIKTENKIGMSNPQIFGDKYNQKQNMVFCLENDDTDYYIIGAEPYETMFISYMTGSCGDNYLDINFSSYYQGQFLQKNK